MNMARKEKTEIVPYQIIEFRDELKKGKRSVELVCFSWLDFEADDKIWCHYPPQNDCKNLDEWIRVNQKPLENWIKYRVTILEDAGDYEQGIRRLERSYKRRTHLRTSDSDCSGTSSIMKISKSKAKNMLRQSQSLFSHPPIDERSEELTQSYEDVCLGKLSGAPTVDNRLHTPPRDRDNVPTRYPSILDITPSTRLTPQNSSCSTDDNGADDKTTSAFDKIDDRTVLETPRMKRPFQDKISSKINVPRFSKNASYRPTPTIVVRLFSA
ncbi:uncharacterized protein [Fopius arisanus]|uniref:Uncharacterized protein n=1 Tax=Fopius arisanus TaxID=64838 RepID=A0A9R1T3T4_9HYME|nr:PREDICTED: uncharacterized protein LOC105266018 [Fopius arisanus]